jgi:hypothetical protein
MMARTQITLDPENHRRARRRAAALGISLAEYVRRLVARDIGQSARTGNPATVFDLGDSGGSNVAAHKDAYVSAAIFERNARRPSRRRRKGP